MSPNFTEDELKKIAKTNPELTQSIKALFIEGIAQIKEQRDLINKAHESFTQRIGVLMSVAGLMSLLLTLVEFDVKHFLIWTFPFLVLAFISFYFSSPRVNALATTIPVATVGSVPELLILNAHRSAQETIWKQEKLLYDGTVESYRLTSMFIYMYMTSFIVSFYVFVFLGKNGLQQALPIFIAAVAIGTYTYFRYKLKSQKNLNFGPKELGLK